jgi:hypothetical protein
MWSVSFAIASRSEASRGESAFASAGVARREKRMRDAEDDERQSSGHEEVAAQFRQWRGGMLSQLM